MRLPFLIHLTQYYKEILAIEMLPTDVMVIKMFSSYRHHTRFIQVIKLGNQKHYALNHYVLWGNALGKLLDFKQLFLKISLGKCIHPYFFFSALFSSLIPESWRLRHRCNVSFTYSWAANSNKRGWFVYCTRSAHSTRQIGCQKYRSTPRVRYVSIFIIQFTCLPSRSFILALFGNST